jgi:hypothetical protein
MNEDQGMRIFLEIHQDNPQEAPGDFASTRRAFSLHQPAALFPCSKTFRHRRTSWMRDADPEDRRLIYAG